MYTHIISDGPKPIWAWNCAFPSEFTGHTRYLALEGTRAVADCDQGRFFGGLPSGKLTVCYGKSLVFNGKTHENSMAMFNSYVCLTEGRVGEIGLI